MNEEINFLLNFKFENAGAQEMAQYMQIFNKVFSELNSLLAISSPLLENYTEQQNALIAVSKNLAEASSLQGKVNKETIQGINDMFQKTLILTEELKNNAAAKKDLIKTTEMLAGEQRGAAKSVGDLSARLAILQGRIKENEAGIKAWDVPKITKEIQELTARLKFWSDELVVTKKAVIEAGEANEKTNGIITQTKEKIASLTAELDKFNTVQELSSKEAVALKDEIAGYNEVLKLLNTQLSGRLTLENALNKTTNVEIQMQNELLAITERNIDLKADMIIAEGAYKDAVADAVNQKLTGYTLVEEAELNRMIVEEENFNKAWILGEEWLKHQEELFNKAWVEGERYQSKQTQLRIDSIKKELAELEAADLKKDELRQKELQKELRYNEERVRAVEVENLKIAKMYIDEINLEVAAQEKLASVESGVSSARVANGEKSIWTLDNIIKKIDFMGLRMIASLFWWGLIIGGVTALYEWWIKVTDQEQAAADRLKDYFESIKTGNKELVDAVPKTQAQIISDQDKADRITHELYREINSGDKEKAYNKYKELQSIGSKILDDVSKEQFMRDGITERMQSQIELLRNTYLPLLRERATLQELSDNTTLRVTKNASDQKTVKQSILDALKDKVNSRQAFSETFGDDITVAYLDYRISKLSDDDKINLLQQQYKGLRKELPEKYNPGYVTDYGNVKANTEILNLLQTQNNIDVPKQGDYKKQLDKYETQVTDLEGNTKDPKTPKGKKPRDIEEERATEKSRNEGAVLDINKKYQDSPRSEEDRFNYYISLQDQSIKHYDAMEAINKKWEKSKEVSNERMKKYREDDKNDAKKTELEMQKDSNKDLMEYQRQSEERLKQIKEVNDKMLKIAEDARRAMEQKGVVSKKNARTNKSAEAFNPLQAFFGGGVGNETQARKDANEGFDDVIKKTADDKKVSGDKFSYALVTRDKAQSQVDSDSKVKNQGELQKQKSKDNLDILNKANSEVESTQKKYNEDAANADKAVQDKKLKNLTDKQKDEVKIAEATFNATTKIANAAFTAQQNRIKQEMENITARYNLERTLAGNNHAANIRLALEEHSKMLALKREEAKSQKSQSIFNATTNAAVAITSALTTAPAPLGIALAVIVAAAAAFQIAAISSQPLPSYKKGRRGGKKEFAQVGEEGFEIGEKNGKFRIFNDEVTTLQEGEIVHTHEKSLKMLSSSDKFLKELLKGTGIRESEKVVVVNSGISKEDMKSAFSEAIKDMKQPIIQLPANGVNERLIRTQLRNNATF